MRGVTLCKLQSSLVRWSAALAITATGMTCDRLRRRSSGRELVCAGGMALGGGGTPGPPTFRKDPDGVAWPDTQGRRP